MKKRTLILIIVFTILGIILFISAFNSECVTDEFGCLISCTENLCLDFGDGTGTCLGCPQCGFKCDTKYLNCTWYPLFFGCINDVPTCFGISCETGGVASVNGFWTSEGVLNTKFVCHDIQEGVDYTIENISYTITTPKGTYTATTFDEMLSNYDVKQYGSGATVEIKIDINALSPIEEMYASATLYYANIYEALIGGESLTYRSSLVTETVTGKQSLVVKVNLSTIELAKLKELENLTINGKVRKYEISEGE